MALEGALLQEEPLPAEELETAEDLLARWEQRLAAPKAAAARGRRRKHADSA
jgi:hypothetical protein